MLVKENRINSDVLEVLHTDLVFNRVLDTDKPSIDNSLKLFF